tara:strand:+ start:4217 stop:4732 length:516 start_codon:yes stop_codon:yes gene_type:complete
MDFQAIHDRLQSIGAPGLTGSDEPRPANKETKDKGRGGTPFVLVEPAKLSDFVRVCRDDADLQMDLMIDITASDPAVDSEDLWVLVQLLSTTKRHRLMIKAILPKANASLPTCVPVYRAAQWNERECAEMFGITFEGHPDPRNILLPDDWIGHPMRKDYEFPKEYHGVSCE